MKNVIIIIVILFSIGTYAQNDLYANNRIIVSLKKEDNKVINSLNEIEELNFLFNDYSIQTIKPLDVSRSNDLNGRPLVIIFDEEINVEVTIQKLKETLLFAYIEPDYISTGSGYNEEQTLEIKQTIQPIATTPNDQYFSRQWGFNNNGTFSLSPATVDADVDMTDAWDITTGSNTVSMAVIDSGIRMGHPEFTGRFLENTAEQTVNGLDDDSNGYIDDYRGWDFVNNDNDPTDDHGHGTNVTGIAVATGNNGIGYAGVDWNCKLLPLKVLNASNSGFNSNIIASLYYAIARNVNLISISIGGSGFSTAYQDVINLAHTQNIPVIACMMNFNNNVPYYPAAFANSIAVGSTDSDDERTSPFFWSLSSGSNYGSHIDVVAPGNYIYGLSYNSNTNYNSYWGGTSQATPLVSGIVSLMLSINPNLTVEEIRTILRNTANDQVGNPTEDTQGWDQYYGSGRVNAHQALLQVQSLSNNTFVKNSSFSIYPNPANESINLVFNLQDIKRISIYDVMGRLIINNVQISKRINISSLNSGVYILKIEDKNNKNHQQKFIKR